MESHRFDTLARRLGGGSRRQALLALVTALGGATLGPFANEAFAACKGFDAKCERGAECCAAAGLRCVKAGNGKKGKGKGKKRRKRCRCKNGTCPSSAPCCVRGECEELCDGECCADCFVLITGSGVPPAPDSDECCPADKLCSSNPNKLSDDRCCLDGEACVQGHCCNTTGALGSVLCGGACCSSAACCNGACCGAGTVCATTPQGVSCVSDSRACGGAGDCFAGEVCHGGVCCSGQRVCSMGAGADVCCAADERCELPGTQFATCCPVNTTCNSFKGQRVRR